jgi:hypothetical protein
VFSEETCEESTEETTYEDTTEETNEESIEQANEEVSEEMNMESSEETDKESSEKKESNEVTYIKEEAILLLSTCGDETGVEYTKSLRSFVKDASYYPMKRVEPGVYAMKMVDPWLNILTQGDHTRTLKDGLELEAAEAEQAQIQKAHEESPKCCKLYVLYWCLTQE